MGRGGGGEVEMKKGDEPVFRISDDSSLATTQRQVHFLAWPGLAHLELNLNLNSSPPPSLLQLEASARRVSPSFIPRSPPRLPATLIFSALLSGAAEGRVHLSGTHAYLKIAAQYDDLLVIHVSKKKGNK